MRFWKSLVTASILLMALMTSYQLSAAPDEKQREELQRLKVDIRKTANYLKSGKVTESVALVKDIQKRLETLSSDDLEVQTAVEELADALSVHHGFLEIEGYTLKPLPTYRSNTTMPAMVGPSPTPTPAPAGLPANFPPANISFTRHVAPILIARCGNCHVTGARGQFSAASYEVLMSSQGSGVVVFPNDDLGSRLIEVIESGDMPRGGGSVRPPELAALKTWIKEGAKFDGPDPKARLNQLAPSAAPVAPVRLEVMDATGREKISFGRDLAGILANRCVGCHSGNNDGGNLSMDNFQRLIRGGDSGAPFVPGKPEESLVIRLFKAPAGDRMPRRGPPLTSEEIAMFETWISEGAKFDGDSAANSSMQRVNDYAKAIEATHTELAKLRQDSSKKKWDLGMPNIESANVETESFLAYGTMGEGALTEHLKTADKAATRVRSILKVPSGQPLVSGKMTLFFFGKRYDYAEFGSMVERREIPEMWSGHWWYDVTDAYAAAQVPSGDEYDMEVVLAQQIASAHVASLGKGSVPNWFAEGVGRVVASRVGNKDARVAKWNDDAMAAMASMTKPDDFINNRLSPEPNALVSYKFVDALMSRGNSFDKMLVEMRKGAKFDTAFRNAFGSTPTQLAQSLAGR